MNVFTNKNLNKSKDKEISWFICKEKYSKKE